jgi:hypothetical protein
MVQSRFHFPMFYSSIITATTIISLVTATTIVSPITATTVQAIPSIAKLLATATDMRYDSYRSGHHQLSPTKRWMT